MQTAISVLNQLGMFSMNERERGREREQGEGERQGVDAITSGITFFCVSVSRLQ